MQRIYLKDRSFSIESLPSEISLLVELMNLCNNDEATFEMFSSAIKRDSVLTAKFLKIANSPLYRQWNEINDLKRMLIVLGLKNVKRIIITSSVQQFFNQLAQQIDLNIHQLWLRSLVCAHLAEKIAQQTGYRKTEEAYLAGLLHQIGILLLLVNDADNYPAILEQYDTTDDFRSLEQDLYGIDHCEVGAALIESWELDSLIADAVLFQCAADNELAASPALLKIISVSQALSSRFDCDIEEQDIEKAKTLLQLSQDSTLECLSSALDESRKVLTELGFANNVGFAEANKGIQGEKHRQQKAAELSDRIKNITLSYCFLNGANENSASFIKEIQINFDLLFNLKQLVFLYRDGEMLAPLNDLQLNKLDEITFPLSDPNSSIVECFNSRKDHNSLAGKCSIADNQIIRVMGAECAYFLPVFSAEENLGVLTVGMAKSELAAFDEKLPLVRLLVTEIGKKYFAIRQAEAPDDSISLTDFNKIVHEVKNPLTIINNYLYILGKKLDENHPAKMEIDFIKEEMSRVSKILSSARNRDQYVGGTEQVDINNLLDELNIFFSNSLFSEKNIHTSLHLDGHIPPLQCPADTLKQIFVNIIKNAVEALPPSGNIEITTRDNCFQNGNQFVEISIKDNGPGIVDDVLRNLFKPVSSTKKGHSGLGLSIVGDLINEISGSVSCYSNQDTGTEFKILLPRLTVEDTE